MDADAAPQVEERRRHSRLDVRVMARLSLVGYTAEGQLENVGAGGVCFRTEDPGLQVEPGNFVYVSFAARREGDVEDVQKAVRVTRIDADPESGPHARVLGLEFEELLRMKGLAF